MPPFLANASSQSFNLQPTAFDFANFNQNQWGPDSIGTLVFGTVMFFMGAVALWQGRARRLRREQDEEIRRCDHVGGRAVDVVDEIAMADLPEVSASERVAVGTWEQDANVDADTNDAMEQGFVKMERGMRTDTEGTLVGHDDDEDETEVKELED